MLSINVARKTSDVAISYRVRNFTVGSESLNVYQILQDLQGNSESFRIGFPPRASAPENQFQDRNCVHKQLKGVVNVQPLIACGSTQTLGINITQYELADGHASPANALFVPWGVSSNIQVDRPGYADPDVYQALPIQHQVLVPSALPGLPSGLSYPVNIFTQKIVNRAAGLRWAEIYQWLVENGSSAPTYCYYRAKMPISTMQWPDDFQPSTIWYRGNFTRYSDTLSLRQQDVEVDKESIREACHRFWDKAQLSPQDDLIDVYGGLAEDIVSDASFPQVNVPAYLRDLLRTPADIVKLARSVRHADIKSLSDSYLSYKYGVSLTVRDTMELVTHLARAIPSFGWSSRKASTTRSIDTVYGSGIVQYAYKVYFSNTPQESIDIIDTLFQTDVIGLGNVWDMIPFSFVADWFIGLGDLLEQLDNTSRFNTLPVISTCRSYRISVNVDDPATIGRITGLSGAISGSVELVDYYRVVSDSLITPRIAWDRPSDFNHFLESGALIVSTQHRRT